MGYSPGLEKTRRLMLHPFKVFTQSDASPGIALLIATAAALLWANSPWAASYHHLWELPISIGLGDTSGALTLHQLVNDGLMAIFFFAVGLEIKRELLVGDLSTAKTAALPIAAALGGMLVPAALYIMLNAGGPGSRGWGVPMATDIAFAIGIVALLGSRVPTGLKVFLTALAIADDLGAVLVIALFYTSAIVWTSLLWGSVVLGLLLLCNRSGIRHPGIYAALGVLLWLAFFTSGVHATVAGVLLAMTIPARTRIDSTDFVTRVRSMLDRFNDAGTPDETILTNEAQQKAISKIEDACEQVQAPLVKLEETLHGFVSFLVMPVFALANAGISLAGGFGQALETPIVPGIILGLVLGKPIGITLFAWLAVHFGLADLPRGSSWATLHGVAWLGGIGFTMSLFIAGLAFHGSDLLHTATLGILVASLIAGVVGSVLLLLLPRLPSAPDTIR